MKWLPLTFKSIPASVPLLHVSFSLSASVTCASPHLICHKIYIYIYIFFFLLCFPTVMLYSQNVACPLSNYREMRGGKKRGEYRDVKLHYGYYSLARYTHPPTHPPPSPCSWPELRMRPQLLMSLRGGTCVETKGCACRPHQNPPPPTPQPPTLPIPSALPRP